MLTGDTEWTAASRTQNIGKTVRKINSLSRSTASTYSDPRITKSLKAVCADVRDRDIDLLAKSHDASHYQLIPRAIVIAQDAVEVARLLATAGAVGVPITFRSGGTSLSGQAGTDGILVDIRKNFRRVEVLDSGALVRAQPGATIRQVNRLLAKHGRKLGPDPASEVACTIGGVVANNSSGMCCGTHANAYQTVSSLKLVLPSGSVIDTGSPDADEDLRRLEPAIHEGLAELRDRIRQNRDWVDTLRRLHAIKNTMGYGLNSFLDYTAPVRILEHLVIGSEGTLAFVAEATFRTIPSMPEAATALLLFTDLAAATEALPALADFGFAAIEVLDASALRVAQAHPEAPEELVNFEVVEHSALLVELQEATAGDLADRMEAAHSLFGTQTFENCPALTTDAKTRSRLWLIRKGLFAAVAGNRPAGTTCILEDIAVPVSRLKETCTGLTALLRTHDYPEPVIFGHAKDGNLHFLINQGFDNAGETAKYEAFTESLVEFILSQGGTLKAEHGTGRMMAPYVHRQYGDELYEIMWEIKRLLDPSAVLNPGVVLSRDPKGHAKHLKLSQAVDAGIDRCVDCGYCEPTCPSRDLTLTPRERIAVRREIQRASEAGARSLARRLELDYRYDGVQTCAVDGMCQTACPVLIDTGDLARRLRRDAQGQVQQSVWHLAARHWDAVSRSGALALSVAGTVPAFFPSAATAAARAIVGEEVVPAYSSDLPRGGIRRKGRTSESATAVYFPSCTSTIFGPGNGGDVSKALLGLCEEAHIDVTTPAGIAGLCCGMPWKSKGLSRGYGEMRDRVARALEESTRGGQLPVICDASSCTEGLRLLLNSAGREDVTVMDAIEFVDQKVLPCLGNVDRLTSITLHPTCSSTRLGSHDSLIRIAEYVAVDVVSPENWGCCAFAGDRGMLRPELTRSATRGEAESVVASSSNAYASTNRTCELGMTRATGRSYRHILQILYESLSASRS